MANTVAGTALTQRDKENITDCINLQIASHKRAKNSSKGPMFDEIYTKLIAELQMLNNKIQTI